MGKPGMDRADFFRRLHCLQIGKMRCVRNFAQSVNYAMLYNSAVINNFLNAAFGNAAAIRKICKRMNDAVRTVHGNKPAGCINFSVFHRNRRNLQVAEFRRRSCIKHSIFFKTKFRFSAADLSRSEYIGKTILHVAD